MIIQDLMMPSFAYIVLSLTTTIILSLAQPNDFDLTTSNLAQSLIDPVAILDESNAPALGFSTGGNADSVGTTQVVVARPDAHGCPKGKIRRRRDETYCPSTAIEVPPSSQQNKPQNGAGQPNNGESGQEKQQDTPASTPAFAPVLEVNCPEHHLPVCVAPNLLENPSAPSGFDTIPWVEHNIPQTIKMEEYCRFCASIWSCRIPFLRFLKSAFGNVSTNRFKSHRVSLGSM